MALRFVAVLVGALVCSLPGFAVAQVIPDFDLERLELNPSGVGSLVVGSAELLPARSWRLTGALHYERNPLVVYRNNARLGELLSDRYTFQMAAVFALHRRLELSLQLPIVPFQQGDDLSSYGLAAPTRAGLGTPTVAARVGLLRSKDGAPFELAAQLGVGIPVGSGGAFTRSSGWSFFPRLLASKTVSIVSGSLDVGGVFRPTTALGIGNLGSELRVGAALSAAFTEALRAEVSFRSAFSREQRASHELLAGGRLRFFQSLDVFVLAGPGIGTSPGTPAYRIVAGAAFERLGEEEAATPKCVAGQPHAVSECPDLDFDGDGITNLADSCAEVREDRDGFEDGDGCPEEDNDKDGVLDAADRCPVDKGEAALQGCPVPDRDHDQVADDSDKCPDLAGPPAREGCPFIDRDGDGIEDATDSCPNEPGPMEARGCPLKDTDADAVFDHVDNCRNEAGPQTNQGCPEKKKQLVAITREALVIKDKVYFAEGSATLLPKSFKLLDQIVLILQDHPEIPVVSIEGHTDARGNSIKNLDLSQKRAYAVRDYLAKKGVAESRLTAKGFGQEVPAQSNLTAKGREANRRVEFNIPAVVRETELEPLVPTKSPR